MTRKLEKKNRTFVSLKFANKNFDKDEKKNNKKCTLNHTTTSRETYNTEEHLRRNRMCAPNNSPGKGYPQKERFPLQNRMNGRTVKKSNGGERHLYQCYVINVFFFSLPHTRERMCECIKDAIKSKMKKKNIQLTYDLIENTCF